MPAKPPFLPSGIAGPSCTHVARRQLVAADRRVGVQRAGAAFDVDPAVAARRAGVARDRVELLPCARSGTWRAPSGAPRAAGSPAPAAPAGRLRARMCQRLAEVDRLGVGVVDRACRRSRWRARPPARLPTQRSAIRLCRIVRASSDDGSCSSESGLVLPGAVLDLDHHARALVEAEVVGRRHVEDAVRAGHLA